jgi:SAM-dependent methyltransferase
MTDRIEPHQCEPDRLGVDAQVDFAMVFAVLHEVPDQERLLREVRCCLRPGGQLLLAEPPVHVTRWKFAAEVAVAEQIGFRLVERPRMRWSHAAVFAR